MSRLDLATFRPPWDSEAPDLLATPDRTRVPPNVREILGDRKLPTPTRSTAPGAFRRPTLGNLCHDQEGNEGCPPPALLERILGLPDGYADPERALVVSRRPPPGVRALRVASVCSGIGAALYGVALAAHDLAFALDVAAAVECSSSAAIVHRARYPDTPVYGNARSPWTQRKLRAGAPYDLGLLTLPCTPYSRRRMHGPGGADHVEHLEVGPIIDALGLPAVVVYETVEGILMDDGRHFRAAVEAMEARGYEVCARILDAETFGALHERERVIVVARRHGSAPVNLDAPHDPRPEMLPEELWLRAPLHEALFCTTINPEEVVRCEHLGGTVCVPVARATGRAAIRLLLDPARST